MIMFLNLFNHFQFTVILKELLSNFELVFPPKKKKKQKLFDVNMSYLAFLNRLPFRFV